MLERPDKIPFTDGNSLAFAIKTTSPAQRHIAILYRHESGAPVLLHLEWHHKLKLENWDSTYWWSNVAGIDVENQETFMDWFEDISSGAQAGMCPIPYSAYFRPKDNFDANGKFIARQDGTGLTCATFVLAAFADWSYELIDADNWPRRPEDYSWWRKILALLRRYTPRTHFLEQVTYRHLLRRFRPEEVLAAGQIYSGVPSNFSMVQAHMVILNPHLP